MFRFIKRLIQLAVIGMVLFGAISLWKGGDEFRRFGETMGNKADEIREKRDEAAEKLKKITGGEGVKEETEESRPDKKNAGKSKVKKTKTEEPPEKREGDKHNLFADLWDVIMKKMKAMLKE